MAECLPIRRTPSKGFAPALLINDDVAGTLESAEEISVTFGVSFESARIYFGRMVELRGRTESAERVTRKAAAFAPASPPSQITQGHYLAEVCPSCGRQTLLPDGPKHRCATCRNVVDRLQDGDALDL